MTDLVDTTEMYLRTLIELEEEQIVPMRARIVERLGHSGPTVSQTVSRMERDGLLLVRDDRHIELTTLGRERAVRVMRKHRLAERLLSDVIGLDWDQVHDEACRWEHVMSEDVERRITRLIAGPPESPYGAPIPGLAELDLPEAESFMAGVERLDSWLAKHDGAGAATLRRLGEPAQYAADVLSELARIGAIPGAKLDFADAGEAGGLEVKVTGPGGSTMIEADVAAHLFVS